MSRIFARRCSRQLASLQRRKRPEKEKAPPEGEASPFELDVLASAALGCRRRRRRWRRWRRSRLLDYGRRRWRGNIGWRRRPVEAHFRAQCHAERPRFAKEGAIELG